MACYPGFFLMTIKNHRNYQVRLFKKNRVHSCIRGIKNNSSLWV
jgi:hypothetical protein